MTPKDDAELAALDLAVAMADGDAVTISGVQPWMDTPTCFVNGIPYRPTTNGAEAMRMLVKYRLNLFAGEPWEAWLEGIKLGVGPTPGIAICRAVVALKGKP